MTDFLVSANTTQTARISMSGIDTLTVEALGTLSVSANAQSVRFNGPTTNGIIINSGLIENTAPGGRAIRIETSVGSNFTASITNNSGATIQSQDDAIQIQAGVVTAGTVTVDNSGLIQSTGAGQGLDLAGGTGAATQFVTNNGAGQILAAGNDAVRIVSGTVNNYGLIHGGSGAGYTQSADGLQVEDNGTAGVTNFTAGEITGDRHGVNGGLNSSVTVVNQFNAIITGNNGSGVGLDGSGIVTNYGTISGNFSNSPGSDINGSTIGQPNGGGPDGINDGDGDGVDIDGLANITNYGLIEGTGAGGTGSDGRFNTAEGIAAGGGTITNHAGATIEGLGLGILIDDSATGSAPFATTVTNDGTITGQTSFAIRLIGTQADVVNNAGTISGGGGTAILFGDGGDTLKVRAGSAITGISDGEAGTDLLDYSAFSGSGVSVDLLAETATGTGGARSFENILGSDRADGLRGSAGDNNIQGGGANDVLAGRSGNDTLDGGEGNDTINGGNGADVLIGGNGTDTLLTVSSGANQRIDLLANTIEGGDSTGDTISGFENVTTGSGNDRVFGSSDANVLIGDAGSDTLVGRGGNDTLNGGEGDDTISGGNGTDTLTGGNGLDTLLTASSGADQRIDLLANTIEGGDSTGDTISGFENATTGGGNDRVLGSIAANIVSGGGGDDTLTGRDGDDTLDGGEGNDTVSGDNGADTLIGGNGIDTLLASSTGGDQTADLEAQTITGGDSTGDTISGFENVTTGSGNDTLLGSSGDNALDGGGGNDVLTGRGGTDLITGGTGQDRFVYTALTDSDILTGWDVIQDFSQSDLDIIDLGLIDAILGAGDDAFVFTSGGGAGAFTGAAGELRFSNNGVTTLIEGDVDGNALADFQIEIASVVALTTADFVL